MATLPLAGSHHHRNIVQELNSIKKQLELLHESLNNLFAEVANQSSWPEVLSRFQILNLRYGQVQEEIARSNVKNYIAFPFGLPEDPEFTARVLLRTKLIPEIEEQQDEIWKLVKSQLEDETIDPKKRAKDHDEAVQSAIRLLRNYSKADDEGEEYRGDLTARLELPSALEKLDKLESKAAKRQLESIMRFQSTGTAAGR